MHPEDLARALNPPQFEAVMQTEGPLLVFAGAGSGKTRVITHRVARIVRDLGAPASSVLAVTFTNKAAGEMRERLHGLLPGGAARGLWISTFHALGARLLRRFHASVGLRQDFTIYDDGDQRSVMGRVYAELDLDDRMVPVRSALGAIDRAKQEVLDPAAFEERAKAPSDFLVARAWAAYEAHLAKNGAVDFGDLISRLARLVEHDEAVRAELQAQFAYVLVDEFQDTNAAQYRILRALVGARRNLCVVGDDDQAIYRWRGADVRNLRYFRRDFPEAKVIKLEENYRSTARILRAANAVISQAAVRERKTLFTKNPEGAPLDVIVCTDERDEARRVAGTVAAALARGTAARDIAVFYRIHAQSRPLEEAMRAANIPYVIHGGTRFYERAEVKDVLSYLRLLLNPNDDVSLLRVVNTPARKIGKTSIDRLVAHATARGDSVWQVLAQDDLPGDLGAAARKALQGFRALLHELHDEAVGMMDRPGDVGRMVFERTGYARMLREGGEVEDETRHENVEELLGSMQAYADEDEAPSLGGYLERVTLSEEAAAADDSPKVAMMTVHSAKGLEFKQVVIVALEDGMFPYKGTELGSDPEEMEEERRLAYVAITRAREHLTLTYAERRQLFGQTRANRRSRFLDELPKDVLAAPPPVRRPAWDDDHGSGYRIEREDGAHGRAHREEVPRADGLVLVREDGPEWRQGLRVRHARFGAGTVRAVHQGAELKVEVYFPTLGNSKLLLAEYLQVLG